LLPNQRHYQADHEVLQQLGKHLKGGESLSQFGNTYSDDDGFDFSNPFLISNDTLDREELLVTVFDAFVATNEGGWRSVEEILNAFKVEGMMYGKHYVKYEHLSIPYLATLWVIRNYKGSVTERWLNIKLCTDGYMFAHVFGKHFIARHNHNHWYRVSEKETSRFQGLLVKFKGNYSKVKIFSNSTIQKVDLKIFANDPKTDMHVLVGFEKGYPAMDEGDHGAYNF